MEEIKQNKMATEPLKGLFWKMGLPMIISMVLQALYNVVDSIFVANMEGTGALANEALTIAFPIQIMIIAMIEPFCLLSSFAGQSLRSAPKILSRSTASRRNAI